MEVKTELILLSEDFPVATVYDEIGLLIGETNIRERTEFKTLINEDFIRPRECSIIYSTDYLETIHVSDSLNAICKIISPKCETIKKVIDQHCLSARFCITLNITDEPEIILPINFVQLAADLHATIEFDTYLDIDKTIEFDEESDSV